MFDFGWSEILVIAIVLIVIVGPKDLPRVLRGFGRTTTKLRAMAGDFRKQFDEALREAELDDVKNLVDEARKLDPRAEIRKHLNPLEQAGRDIRSGLNGAAKPKPAPAPSTPAVPAPQTAEPLKPGAANLPGEGAAKPAEPVKPAPKRTAAKAKVKPTPRTVAEPAKAKPADPAAAKQKAKAAPRAKKTVGPAS